MTEKLRECTCHPDDAVKPCAQRFAASECHDELTDDEVEGFKLSSAFFVTVAEQQAYNRAIDDLRKRGMIRRGR